MLKIFQISLLRSVYARIIKASRRWVLSNYKISPGIYQAFCKSSSGMSRCLYSKSSRKNNLCEQDSNKSSALSCGINTIIFYLNCQLTNRLGDTLFVIQAIKNIHLTHILNIKIIIISHQANHDLIYYTLSSFSNISIIQDLEHKENNSICKKANNCLADYHKYCVFSNDQSSNIFVISYIGNLKLSIKNLINTSINFLIFDPHKFDYKDTIVHFIQQQLTGIYKLLSSNDSSGYIIVSLDLGSQNFLNTASKQAQIIDYARLYLENKPLINMIVFSDNTQNINIKINNPDSPNSTINSSRVKFLSPSSINTKEFSDLIFNVDCKAVFTYDSFVMHYSLLANVGDVYVKFRGKINQHEYNQHFKKINNAFCDNIYYI